LPDSPRVHILHDNADVYVDGEAAVISDDIGRRAVIHDLQLAEDLLPDGRFRVDENELSLLLAIGRR
jgi:hypothetical protein